MIFVSPCSFAMKIWKHLDRIYAGLEIKNDSQGSHASLKTWKKSWISKFFLRPGKSLGIWFPSLKFVDLVLNLVHLDKSMIFIYFTGFVMNIFQWESVIYFLNIQYLMKLYMENCFRKFWKKSWISSAKMWGTLDSLLTQCLLFDWDFNTHKN